MIQCPRCEHVTADISVSGPVLWASGVITFADNAKTVVAISPLMATQTIEAGKELTSNILTLTCPACGHAGAVDDFMFVAQCIITGKPTTRFVSTPFGDLPAVEAAFAEVTRVFTKAAGQWESSIEEQDYV